MIINTRDRTSLENRHAIIEAVKAHGIAHMVKAGDTKVTGVGRDGKVYSITVSCNIGPAALDQKIADLAQTLRGTQ
ncbi:hypothetical protein [uncultured Paracoccus sp.]|uniref:hypothetical protein n=1 Tax=uncultured Paracoccus sp. TaxID=189685 RepID=UPI0026292566|nr:hypothetical protein [uncultured Paracoccus sp.]